MTKPKSTHISFLFIVNALLLAVVGLVFVFESSVAESFSQYGHPYHFIRLQIIRFIFGLICMSTTLILPIKFWQKISHWLYFLSLLLLILVFVPGLGLNLNGANRWLQIGSIVFQPVEIMKLGIIIFFSNWLTKHQKILPFLFLTLLPSLLLILQPDFGSLLIILSIAFSLYFVSGGNLGQLSLISFLALGLLLIAIFGSNYRLNRVITFLNPESDPLGKSFHIRQITLALGNGSWFGQGIGKSKQKFAYIPEASTDSIFAIIAEEIGFVGSLLIMGLFISYFILGLKIIKKQKPNSFAFLTGLGIMIWFISQTLLNLSAVVALIPLTGLPLPFFSYGGTSLLMMLINTGIMIRISKNKS